VRGEFVKVFPHEYRRALAKKASVRRATGEPARALA